MLAIELVADIIPPVHTSDTIQKVIDRMYEFRIKHLPIVNENQFLGLISEDDLIKETNFELPIGALSLSLVNPFVIEDQHIYDVIRIFHEQNLTMVPVLDIKDNYLGLISINNLNDYFATMTSIEQPGGIIVLEVYNNSNTLAQMAQIVESDNAQVLSSYVRSFPGSSKMEITLKVNKQDISAIVATFLRYEYEIKATFNNKNNNDSVKDRYNLLMNYLNL